jgi:hypothetical protein
MLDRRGNLDPAQIGAAEPDAEVGRGRLERELDLLTGVKTDAGTGNRSAKCPLCFHSASARIWSHSAASKEDTATNQDGIDSVNTWS